MEGRWSGGFGRAQSRQLTRSAPLAPRLPRMMEQRPARRAALACGAPGAPGSSVRFSQHGNPATRTFAEILIDCKEDRTLRTVLVRITGAILSAIEVGERQDVEQLGARGAGPTESRRSRSRRSPSGRAGRPAFLASGLRAAPTFRSRRDLPPIPEPALAVALNRSGGARVVGDPAGRW